MMKYVSERMLITLNFSFIVDFKTGFLYGWWIVGVVDGGGVNSVEGRGGGVGVNCEKKKIIQEYNFEKKSLNYFQRQTTRSRKQKNGIKLIYTNKNGNINDSS